MAPAQSLKLRIAGAIFVLEALTLLLVLWPVMDELHGSAHSQLAAQERISLDLLADLGRNALLTEAYVELQPQLETLRNAERINAAVLADGRGRIVAASDPHLLGRQLEQLEPGRNASLQQKDIANAAGKLGTVAIEFSRLALMEAEDRARMLALGIAVFGLLGSAIIGLAIGWALTRRLDVLTQAADRMAEGDLAVQAGLPGGDEIARLGHAFDTMATRIRSEHEAILKLNEELETKVRQRTAAVEASNAQLREALDIVQRTQDELVRSEKLASLGALVAGIAHELNTPIGSSLTVASTLADKTRDIVQSAVSGSLRRSQLDEFTSQAAEATRQMLASLTQAGELIAHFKQLAVDQTSAQRREFDLADIIDDVLLAVRPAFRHTRHEIVNQIGRGLVCDSYPGPLGQILAQLINNAQVHGFAGQEAGTITLRAREDGERVCIEVADDGIGIAPAVLPRIFDPFFSTGFGQGKSGLGLHIVYSIATRILGGSVSCSSDLRAGTVFSLAFPRVAPRTAPTE